MDLYDRGGEITHDSWHAALMIVFFLAGLHVAGALGLIGMILMYLFSDRPLWDMLGQIAWNVNSSFVLVAVPPVCDDG